MTTPMTTQEIERFFEKLSAINPNPKGELESVNPFTLLIAVVLSARATDKGVNKATKELFKVADTPQKMLVLGEEGLKRYINTIGLYNAKARNIMGLCQKLVNDFGGQIPDNRDALESLPGVGRKTANVVLNAAFHEPVIAVDTHIFRVSNRTGLANGKTPLDVEKELMKRIPSRWLKNAHHWLVLHGRYICVARKPHCPVCPVREECHYPHKTKAL
ncbi:MAG: endonuclease III [Alphaproteobacteria bacterium 41-28]|nr:MAG: endonuclease III [Alphaproteobacteria bacterium 41-28]